MITRAGKLREMPAIYSTPHPHSCIHGLVEVFDFASFHWSPVVAHGIGPRGRWQLTLFEVCLWVVRGRRGTMAGLGQIGARVVIIRQSGHPKQRGPN